MATSTKTRTTTTTTFKPKYSAGEVAMAKLFEPKKAAAMVKANTPPVTFNEREAVRARAIAAGKNPTTAAINATVAKNRAAAAKIAPTVPRTGLGPMIGGDVNGAQGPLVGGDIVGPAPGTLPPGSQGVVLGGPTAAGLAAAAQVEAIEKKARRRGAGTSPVNKGDLEANPAGGVGHFVGGGGDADRGGWKYAPERKGGPKTEEEKAADAVAREAAKAAQEAAKIAREQAKAAEQAYRKAYEDAYKAERDRIAQLRKEQGGTGAITPTGPPPPYAGSLDIGYRPDLGGGWNPTYWRPSAQRRSGGKRRRTG